MISCAWMFLSPFIFSDNIVLREAFYFTPVEVGCVCGYYSFEQELDYWMRDAK